MSEIVTHSRDNVQTIESFMQANVCLADPISRRDYFEHVDGDGFIDFLQQNASLVRTGNDEVKQPFDGEKVGLAGHEVPDQRDKERLLRDTWDVARTFLRDRGLSDEDALERAALAVAGGVLLAHPFIDGNGRTSRLSSLMIARGVVGEEILANVLGKSSGTGGWEVSPIYVSKPSKGKYNGNQPDEITWDFQFAGEAEDALGGVIADSLYKNDILREFIELHSDATTSKQADYTKEVNGKDVLDGDNYLRAVVTGEDGGITNAREILRIHRRVRADYVNRYLEALLSGSRAPLGRGLTPRKNTQGEYLDVRDKIAAEYLGTYALGGMLTPVEQQILRHRIGSTLRHEPFADKDSAA